MPAFGKTSKENLYSTKNKQLILLFEEVVKYIDCSVVSGRRLQAEQQLLYAQGRTMPGPIITNCDGISILSAHQAVSGELVSNAADVVPFPIDWNDKIRFYNFIGFVRGVASQMKIEIISGSDWDSDYILNDQNFYDLPHWETPSNM